MSDIDWPRVLGYVGTTVVLALTTGALKASGRLPCDVSRKINHIYALVGGVMWFGWLTPTTAMNSTYCAAAILLVLVTITCTFRDRRPMLFAFLANTRRSDAPHESFYFWSSWSMSIAALAGIQLVVNDVVITRTAALLVGIGDGIAEPIGRRFGRHQYRVPSLTSGSFAIRSLEGSASVFVGCFATLIACFGWNAMTGAMGLALLLTLVEAVSPHGLDNVTIPVVAALVLPSVIAIS